MTVLLFTAMLCDDEPSTIVLAALSVRQIIQRLRSTFTSVDAQESLYAMQLELQPLYDFRPCMFCDILKALGSMHACDITVAQEG